MPSHYTAEVIVRIKGDFLEMLRAGVKVEVAENMLGLPPQMIRHWAWGDPEFAKAWSDCTNRRDKIVAYIPQNWRERIRTRSE